MKRNMDLCRWILQEVEKQPHAMGFEDLASEQYSDEEISYHVMLLAEAGYLNAVDCSSLDGICWKPQRLTWLGHEFVDASRDEGTWKKAKNIVQEKGGSFTVEVLLELLKRLIGAAL